MGVSKESLQAALLAAIPESYRPTVMSILEVERAYLPALQDVIFEVDINVLRHSDQKRVSSFLTVSNGLVIEESQVSERFARTLLDIGIAKKKEGA